MKIEEKKQKAKEHYKEIGVCVEEFEISRIEEIEADFLFPKTDLRGLGGIIIADDGTNLVCGSIYSLSRYIEEFKLRKITQEEINQIEKWKSDGESYAKKFDEEYDKMTKEEKEQTNQIMKELDEIIGFDGDKTEQKDTRLQRLIEENCGPDPFWKDCLDNYFKNVNKTEKEKEDFLWAISKDKMLFNEFTKEIVKVSLKILNADLVFEKYKTIINDKNING